MKIFSVLLFCISITIILNGIGSETLLLFFKWSLILLSFFLFLKELKILVRFFLNYMFVNPTSFFDKFIERPRLFVYATAGNISLFILFIYFNIDLVFHPIALFAKSLLLTAYFILSYFLHFTWNEKFRTVFINKGKEKLLASQKNYIEELSAIKEYLESVYDNLYDSEFIEIIDPDLDYKDRIIFSETLLSDIKPKKPIFELKMNNIQTKYFCIELSQRVENFDLEVLLKVFRNKNKKATKNSIDVSYARRKRIKKRKEIDKCLQI